MTVVLTNQSVIAARRILDPLPNLLSHARITDSDVVPDDIRDGGGGTEHTTSVSGTSTSWVLHHHQLLPILVASQ
jgi:hypothetical protein